MADEVTVVIPIFPEVTQLDFTGPHQVFSRVPGMRVITASVRAAPVTGDGLTFSNLADLATLERCDVLLVPGGSVVAAIQDEAYMAAIRRLASTARYVVSVCTGSLILGAAGLLLGKHAACHWASRHLLPLVGAIPDDRRVARDGNLFTGGGVTAGIDVALTMVAELWGPDIAQTVQLRLEYAPQPPFGAGRPELAPASIVRALRDQTEATDQRRRSVMESAGRRLRELGPLEEGVR